MTNEILNIIGPVFLVAGIGFFLEYRGIGFQQESLSRLTMLIGTPCLVFSSLTNTVLPDDRLVRIVVIAFSAASIGAILSGSHFLFCVSHGGLFWGLCPFQMRAMRGCHWCFSPLLSLGFRLERLSFSLLHCCNTPSFQPS